MFVCRLIWIAAAGANIFACMDERLDANRVHKERQNFVIFAHGVPRSADVIGVIRR